MVTLQQYIYTECDGKKVKFAEKAGRKKQQVNTMLEHGGYYVHKGSLYIKRIDLNEGDKNEEQQK